MSVRYRIYKVAPGGYEIVSDAGDWPPASWSLSRQGVIEFFQDKCLAYHGHNTAIWDAKRSDIEKRLEEPSLGPKGVIQI